MFAVVRQLSGELERLLTPRQREILEFVSLGLTNTEIAQRVNISEAGVRYHVSEIMNKLGVDNRYEAATWPERPPWRAAAFAPAVLLWRRATAVLPVKAGGAAMVVSGGSFAAGVAGLALIAVLLVRAGGGPGPSFVDAQTSDGTPALVAAQLPGESPSIASHQEPGTPTPEPRLPAPNEPADLLPPAADDPESAEPSSPTVAPPTLETPKQPPAATPAPCSTDACLGLGPAPEPIAGQPDGGTMAVDCDPGRPGVQASCAYPSGAAFAVQVHVTQVPEGYSIDSPAIPAGSGYFALQTKVAWDNSLFDYLAAPDSTDEALWADCDIPARNDNRAWEPSVLFACVPAPQLPQGSTYTGAVLQFQFRCVQPGDAVLALVPRAGDLQLGSHFLSEYMNIIDPTLAGARVACGPCPAGGCAPPPPPAPTDLPPSVTPAPTPTPFGSGGMAVDCDALSPGIQDACAYPTGARFDVQVNFTYAPAAGFLAFDVILSWADALDYLPTAETEDELLWTECDAAPRSYAHEPGYGPWLMFGCLPVPERSYTATGAMLQFEYQCVQDGAALVDLRVRAGALSPSPEANGLSRFTIDQMNVVFPTLSPATITCG